MTQRKARTSPRRTAELRSLAEPSDRRGLLQTGLHGAALILSGTLLLITADSWWVLPFLPLHGVLLVFLFAPLHETIHYTAFKSRGLNHALSLLCGWLLLLPPACFRSYHLAHHRYTQDPARDPELLCRKPDSRGRWLLHVSGLPFWASGLAALLRQAAGEVREPFVPRRERRRIVWEARAFLALYGAVILLSAITGSRLALWLWIIPVLLGQPILRLFLLAEHSGRPLVPDMLQNSRTTRTTGLLRWLAWNMPYHAEHHYFPALPFHALPRAHALLAGDLGELGSGYVAVNRAILRQLD